MSQAPETKIQILEGSLASTWNELKNIKNENKQLSDQVKIANRLIAARHADIINIVKLMIMFPRT